MEEESRMAARIRRAAELKKNPGTSRNIDADGPELTEEDERNLDKMEAKHRRQIVENPKKYGIKNKAWFDKLREIVEAEDQVQNKGDADTKGS